LTSPEKLPYYNAKQTITDDSGNPIPRPDYAGIQSLVEYLYFVNPKGHRESMHDSENCKLHLNTSVMKITKREQVTSVRYRSIQRGRTIERTEHFNYVLVTSPTWASETSFQFEGFTEQMLPRKKLTAAAIQHSISSCKLFFPLRKKYWEDLKIPQIIITDTYIQDVYGLSWESRSNDRGILLASYTWEDDSLKLLPFNERELTDLVLNKLQAIIKETIDENIDIKEYIDHDKPVHIQWMAEPTYQGAAKLYRAHTETINQLDLAYNEKYASLSNLYFAGESYSVEGGWTEPALRSALDAVMRLLKNEGARFLVEEFSYENDYPTWKPQKSPTYTFD